MLLLLFSLVDQLAQVGFGALPIGFVHDLFETCFHTGRDTFVPWFTILVPIGTFFNNGLDLLM